MRRLAHRQRVTLQPCDQRGRPREGTQPIDGSAEVVTGAQLDAISVALKAKYGFMVNVVHVYERLSGLFKRKKMPAGDRGVVITATTDPD